MNFSGESLYSQTIVPITPFSNYIGLILFSYGDTISVLYFVKLMLYSIPVRNFEYVWYRNIGIDKFIDKAKKLNFAYHIKIVLITNKNNR